MVKQNSLVLFMKFKLSGHVPDGKVLIAVVRADLLSLVVRVSASTPYPPSTVVSGPCQKWWLVWSFVLFANEETSCFSFVDDGRKVTVAFAVHCPSLVSAHWAPVPTERAEKGRLCCLCGVLSEWGSEASPRQWAWLQERSVSSKLSVTGTPLKHLRQRPLFSLLVKRSGVWNPGKFSLSCPRWWPNEYVCL